MRYELRVPQPFDFAKIIRRPLARPSQLVHVDLEAETYTRAFDVDGRVVPVTVSATVSSNGATLNWMLPDGASPSAVAVIEARLRRMFCVDEDVAGFYEQMSRDATWSSLIERFYGLRPLLDGDLFEAVVNVIVGQQLNVKFAATLVERLITLGGQTVEWGGRTLSVFPTAQQVAGWAYADLRALSFSQRKAEYVIDFARAVAEGRLDLDAMLAMPEDEIYDTLLPMRGIGRWTVECVLLFGLGRRDVLPAADIGLQNAIQKLYGVSPRPGEDDVRRLAEPWAPWRSWATYYLWQSLNP